MDAAASWLMTAPIDVGNIDPVYRDLSLNRARTLLTPVLSQEEFPSSEGRGQQPYWTHFDGYLIRTVAGPVRFRALAGGDARYGGLYELLAVAQRARMVAW